MSKAKEARKTVVVRFPADLHARVKKEADERDTSLNFLMVRALESYLSHLPPLDPEFEETRRGETA